jgi:quinol monooxygenase YgiN
MYARMVSFVTQPSMRTQLCKVIEEEVVPLVKQHSGFVEHITLMAEQEPRLVMVISLWKKKADAEDFRQTIYPTILQHLKPLLATDPTVTEFRCISAEGQRRRGKLLQCPLNGTTDVG